MFSGSAKKALAKELNTNCIFLGKKVLLANCAKFSLSNCLKVLSKSNFSKCNKGALKGFNRVGQP